MKPILILLAILLSLHCAAQYDTMGRFLIRQLPVRYVAIKWAPASLIEPDNRNIAVAVERRFGLKNAVQLQVGYTLPERKTVDGSIVASNGFRLRLEYRKYVIPLLYNGDWYWASELFYTQYRYPAIDRFSDDIHSNSYEDEFILDKKMAGIAGKLGFQRRFLKHFIFDVNIGVGIKYRHVTHERRTDETDNFIGLHPNFNNVSHAAGSALSVAVPGNIFIGYFF